MDFIDLKAARVGLGQDSFLPPTQAKLDVRYMDIRFGYINEECRDVDENRFALIGKV